jgi:uncharacterized membrane-anchored protein
MESKKGKAGFIWAGVGVSVWLIINIRVEAGLGTTFERAVDGLVGGVVLLGAIFLAIRFFQCNRQGCRNSKSCFKG